MGYAGGTTPDPTYRDMGDHTETVQLDYDPDVIGYDDLLREFWLQHRPVRPSVTRQYASVIFYSNDAERVAAEASKRSTEAELGPLFTDILPLGCFYLAEDYHQHYYAKNGLACAACPAGRGEARR